MRREPLVQEREVRIDDVSRGQITPDHLVEIEARLGRRGFRECIVEIVVVVERRGGRGVLDFPQVDPVIEEAMHEPARVRAGEQPLGFTAQDFGAIEIPPVSARAKVRVGNRVREKEREPGGERVIVESARFLLEENETGGSEYRSVAGNHRLSEAQAGLHPLIKQCDEPLHVIIRDGSSVSTLHEIFQQAPRIGRRIL